MKTKVMETKSWKDIKDTPFTEKKAQIAETNLKEILNLLKLVFFYEMQEKKRI